MVAFKLNSLNRHTCLSAEIGSLSNNEFKYVISFTVKFSGSLFTYFVKKKSDAVNATERFLPDVEPYGKTKTLSFYDEVFPSVKRKHVCSDNGGEYLSKEVRGPLIQSSVKHEFTSLYLPSPKWYSRTKLAHFV